MLYDFHSPELEFMNQTEFECLVHVAKKREHYESTKNGQFDLSPISGIASSKSLFLSAKQCVPIFTCCVPPHPGAKPTQHNGPEWKL